MSTTIAELTDYATTRARVLATAEALGATLSAYTHPLLGPSGEVLTTDVARFGASIGEADTVVLISSGLHGVEGHAGSGLQELLLASGRLGSLPAGVAVVLVHAVNPYGYAWSRRVDADNIDVNRNWLPDYTDLPANPRYGDIDPLLNPTELDLADTSFLGELAAFWAEVGDDVMFRTVSGGQYSHPAGVQFGGQHASWSRTMLEQLWADQLVGARTALALDIHTGLGPEGRLTIFQTADADETAATVGDAWYPNLLFRSSRTGTDHVDHGLLGPGFDAWAAGRLDTATFVVEFGTLDPTQGVTVFRADNWLHHHGDPRSAEGETIRAMMRDFFFLPDETWRSNVAEHGMAALHTALDRLPDLQG